MPTLTLKNIPDDLYTQLKERARINRRSINSEIIMCIEKTLRSNRLNAESMLTTARNLRESTSGYIITDEEFDQSKTAGRP
jgi:plasmid stability protein